MADNRGLRHSKSLQFLDLQNEDEDLPQHKTDYLHEAQVSCVITGTDHWKWVAYCFADTYFDGQATRDSVESYHGDAMDGMRPDPLVLGRNDANKPITAPRDYFVRVFEVRLTQVRQEWVNIIEKLEPKIIEYVRSRLLPITRRHCL